MSVFMDRKINTVEMSVLPNLNLKIQHNPNQNPRKLFLDIDKMILNLYGEAEDPD